MITWAFIYEHPGTDPSAERVADETRAAAAAVDLIEQDGAALIELCGGFSTARAAAVVDAVGGRVPVGHVAYAVESLEGAAGYKALFEADR
jgi:hypothetical protein